MARPEHSVAPHPRVRRYGMLVATLLLGLLGMHGLGPVPLAHPATGHAMTAMTAAMGQKVSTSDPCEHDAGDGGHHMPHADATCASASVAGTPAVVPLLVPDVAARAQLPDALGSLTGGGPDGGRAPPSLSELQLLRI
ncbi:hypothetical protein SAMN05216489_01670 [Streptomyces sp. 3213]|uniref:DUF6153 family protein n=1 Tax=Streptomyces sp. 3213.3 TaxID=1855348 RepID=UPI000897F2B6|nr:DUF6153 family protein [Streptomyces sp. 3213.3]SEC80459.1 hypothetical protein SAMN05216489_01670 [Streptomyces sp. 3213] [Streptomyces sp. 3213.3]